MKVNQPSAKPTNKLTAAMIVSAIVGVAQGLTRKYIPELDIPEIWIAANTLLIGWVGAMVKDEANVKLG